MDEAIRMNKSLYLMAMNYKNCLRWRETVICKPEPFTHVLAWRKGSAIKVAWFEGDVWTWEDSEKPTHWLPMPPSPNEAESFYLDLEMRRTSGQ